MSSISFIPKNSLKPKPKPKSFLFGAPFKNKDTLKTPPDRVNLLPQNVSSPNSALIPSKLAKPQESSAASSQAPALLQELSLDTLNSAQATALSSLPAPASLALKEVWSQVDGYEDAHSQLLDLLSNGTLAETEQDSSLVEKLHKLSTSPKADGLDPRGLTAQTLAVLTKPEKNIYQGSELSTCGSAILQAQLAENPSLLVQVVDDLSSPNGTFSVGEGAEIKRADGVAEPDGSGRNQLDRLMQGSLMSFAGKSNGRYDVLADAFSNGDKGLRVTEIAQASATLEGQDYAILVHDGETSSEVHRVIKSLPEDETVQLGVYWGETDHIVAILRREGEDAHYFDPINHENEKMPLDDLLFKTQVAILPAKYVQDVDVPDDALYTYKPE